MNASRIALAVFSLAAPVLAAGQQLLCSSSDRHCLDREYVKACGDLRSSIDSCLVWAQQIQSRPDGDHRLILLASASAYTNIAAIGDVDNREVFRQRAEQIYRDLVRRNPSDTDALMGLVSLAEDQVREMELLEEIIAIEPHNAFALELLGKALASTGRREDLIESAKLLERAYGLLEPKKKWNVASDVVSRYRRAQDGASANAFVAKVRQDMSLDRRMAELALPDTVGPARIEESLDLICFDALIRIFGSLSCIDGIHAVTDHIFENTDASDAPVLAAIAGSAIASVLWYEGQVSPDSRASLMGILSAFRESELATAPIHIAYARASTDPTVRLSAMQDAARLAPDDGEVFFGLALAYFDLQRWNEATEEFRKARELLPETRHIQIDQLLNEALRNLESPIGDP